MKCVNTWKAKGWVSEDRNNKVTLLLTTPRSDTQVVYMRFNLSEPEIVLKGLVRARAFNQPELFLAMNDPLPKQKHCKQERLSRLTRQEEMKNNVKPNK